jgi:hypothetical protein
VVAKIEHHNGELFPGVGFIATNLQRPAPKVVKFYNGRGTAEQWIKEGKYAMKLDKVDLPRLCGQPSKVATICTGLQLGRFLRRLALPELMKRWSLETLLKKLIKLGANVIRHSRYVAFQMAEAMVSRRLFAEILNRIRLLAVLKPRALVLR